MPRKGDAMTGALLMPREKKPVANEKFSEQVRLRPTFKRKLQRVAEAGGLEMGEMIEQHMKALIEQEYLRVLREELHEAEGDARPKK
jgi:hypothetical protein